MSTSMINPVEDLAPLNSVADFDTELNPCARCLMITEDKAIQIVTGNGNIRTYPAGTFNIKSIYPIIVQKVRSAGTEVGAQKIYLGFDRRQA